MAQAQVTITAVDKTQAAINSAMRGLKGIGDQVSVLKRAFAGIGTVAVGQFLVRTASEAIKYGDELSKASVKSGLAAQTIQSLAFAVGKTNGELVGFSDSLRKMQINLSQAASGGKAQKETLDALGISIQEIRALQPDRQFELIADRISMLKDPADKARAANELFGKSGAELLPAFEKGAAGIRAAREEAENLGLILSEQQVQALAEADSVLKKFTQSWDAFAAKLTSAVLPAITSVLREISGMQTIDVQLTRAVSEVERIKKTLSELPGDGGAFGKQLQKDLNAQIEIIKKLMGSAATSVAAPSANKVPGFIDKSKEEEAKKLRDELQKLNESTMKSFEKTALEFNKFSSAVDRLIREKIISPELGTERILEYLDTVLPEYKVQSKRADPVKELKDQTDQMQEFAKAAAQNIQSAFADFLFDPFENGLRGMLSGFMNIIRRMVAEIAAQEILKAIFLPFASGSGFFANFAKSLTGKAMGGPVSANTPYIVGERGPELFVPGTSGGIVPNNKLGMGGGVTVAPVYNIDARGATADLQRSLPGILQENNRRIFDELDRRYGIGR